MKTSKEMADSVLQIRDEHIERSKIRRIKIKRISSAAVSACAAVSAVFSIKYIYNNNIFPRENNSVIESSVQPDSETAAGNHTTDITEKNTEAVTKTEKAEISVIITTEKGSASNEKSSTADSQANSESTTAVFSAESASDTVTNTTSAHPQTSINTTTNKSIDSAIRTTSPVTKPLTSAISKTNTTVTAIQQAASVTQTASQPTTSQTTQPVTTEEDITDTKWDEKTITSKFPEFEYDGKIFGFRDAVTDTGNIGAKSDTVSLVSVDYHTDKEYSIEADIYRITGISDSCNVVVRFKGYDNYYVYFNRNYYPATLGELTDNLCLENTISFGDMSINGSVISEYDRNAVKQLLLNNRECQCIQDDLFHETLISFAANVSIIGVNGKSLSVTKDGYIFTNIAEWGCFFYIGEDAANEFYSLFDDTEDISGT